MMHNVFLHVSDRVNTDQTAHHADHHAHNNGQVIHDNMIPAFHSQTGKLHPGNGDGLCRRKQSDVVLFIPKSIIKHKAHQAELGQKKDFVEQLGIHKIGLIVPAAQSAYGKSRYHRDDENAACKYEAVTQFSGLAH